MGVAVRGGPRKKRLDRFYLYSEYLMHYIFRLGGMVLVAFLMKKLIYSLLPLDQNPELMNPSVKFPLDLQEFLHQGRNVNQS